MVPNTFPKTKKKCHLRLFNKQNSIQVNEGFRFEIWNEFLGTRIGLFAIKTIPPPSLPLKK